MEQFSQKPQDKPMLKFDEHRGIETEMTGLRVWYCELQGTQYAIWEIDYQTDDNREIELPYYRVNWRSYNPNSNPAHLGSWDIIVDCEDFESAIHAASQHSSELKNE